MRVSTCAGVDNRRAADAPCTFPIALSRFAYIMQYTNEKQNDNTIQSVLVPNKNERILQAQQNKV